MRDQEIADGTGKRNPRRVLLGVLVAPLLLAFPQTAAAQAVKVQFNGPQPVQFNGPQPVQFNGAQPVQSANTPPAVVNNQSIVPVLTRSIDEPARRPFQQTFSCSIPAGNSSNTCSVTFVVPADQAVVIEYVNVSGEFMQGSQPASYQLLTTVGGNSAEYQFFPGQALGFGGQFTGSQMVHISADAGSTIRFNGWDTSTAGNANLHMVISGYIVSVP